MRSSLSGGKGVDMFAEARPAQALTRKGSKSVESPAKKPKHAALVCSPLAARSQCGAAPCGSPRASASAPAEDDATSVAGSILEMEIGLGEHGE